jgi:preprotein translocase subunit SecG
MEEMCNKIILKFTFEEKDILHVHKVNFKKIVRIPKVFYIMAGLFIFTIIIYAQNASNTIPLSDINNNSSLSLIKPILLAVVFISVVLIIPILTRREVIKNFKNNKMLQNEMEYTISEDEISCHTTISDNHYDWSYFNKIVETKHGFILYLSNNTVIFLPKRSFSDKNEISAVRNILMSNFKGKKYRAYK